EVLSVRPAHQGVAQVVSPTEGKAEDRPDKSRGRADEERQGRQHQQAAVFRGGLGSTFLFGRHRRCLGEGGHLTPVPGTFFSSSPRPRVQGRGEEEATGTGIILEKSSPPAPGAPARK